MVRAVHPWWRCAAACLALAVLVAPMPRAEAGEAQPGPMATRAPDVTIDDLERAITEALATPVGALRRERLSGALSLYDTVRLSSPDEAAHFDAAPLIAAAADAELSFAEDPKTARALGDAAAERARLVAEGSADPTIRANLLARLSEYKLTRSSVDESWPLLVSAYAASAEIADAQARDGVLVRLVRAAIRTTPVGRQRAVEWAGNLADPALRRAAMRASVLAIIAAQESSGELVSTIGSTTGREQALALDRLVDAYLAENRFTKALFAALAIEDSYASERDNGLVRILDRQIQMNDEPEQVRAPFLITDPTRRSKELRRLVEVLAEKRRLADARRTLGSIDVPSDRVAASLAILAWLQREGYTLQLAAAFDFAEAAARRLSNGLDREAALMRLATIAASSDAISRAETFLGDVRRVDHRQAVMAAIALAYVRRGDGESATKWANQMRADTRRDDAFAALVEFYLTREVPDLAAGAALRVGSARARIEVEISYAERARRGFGPQAGFDRLVRARALARQLPPGPVQQSALLALAKAYAAAGNVDEARSLAMTLSGPVDREKAVLALADGLAREGSLAAARALEDILISPASKARLRRVVARSLSERGEIAPALELALTIANDRLRTSALREIAEQQARGKDSFGLLGKAATRVDFDDTDARVPPSLTLADVRLAYDRARGAGDALPPIPDLNRLTGRAVREQVPAIAPGRVRVLPVFFSAFHEKFSALRQLGHTDNEVFYESQGTRTPRFILIESGTFDLPALRDKLLATGEETLLLRKGRDYELRVPLVVGPDATLVITNADVDVLRLSTNHGAYLINNGTFYLVGAALTSYDGKTGLPTPRRYEDKRQFNPFFAAWSGSKTFIAHARIEALGYGDIKSYGFSITSGPRDAIEAKGYDVPRPTGIIVDSVFKHMFYGFYSYEADDVVLVGNEYVSNEIYGIDPHDRSLRLIIAYNTTHDTRLKHGIIGSREVNESFYVGNVSFRNGGSGLMLDRKSIDNLVYANHLFENGQDGISLFESACNIVARNATLNNERDGIKVRNSWDVGVFQNLVADNHGYGVNAYAVRLEDVPGQAHRDFAYDPYHPYTTSFVIGNDLLRNRAGGIMARQTVAMTLKTNRFVGQGRKTLVGLLEPVGEHVLRGAQDGVAIAERCPPARPADRCGLREQGYLGRIDKFEEPEAATPSCVDDEARSEDPDRLAQAGAP